MLYIENKTKYAALFPGQGSQYKGMLSGIENSKYLQEILPIANEICSIDFFELMTNDSENKLNLTQYTQPALLITSYVLWKHFGDYLNSKNLPKPNFVAGHSLGEYSALVASEVINIKDAISLVYHRGLYMNEAGVNNPGAMAAILGLENEKVAKIAYDFKIENNNEGLILEVANYNALGQVVVSGTKEAIDSFTIYAKENGAKIATILPVSVAAHSSLMTSAANKLKALLDTIEFNSPKIPVFSNVSANLHNNNVADIKNDLFKQMTSSVRWVEIIQNLKKFEVETTYEIGVNSVLTKLNKRIDKTINSYEFNDIKELECS